MHRSTIYRLKFKNIIEAWELDHFDHHLEKLSSEKTEGQTDSNDLKKKSKISLLFKKKRRKIKKQILI